MAIKDRWKQMYMKPYTSAPKPRTGTEIGFTGSKVMSGLPFDEYNPELQFPRSVHEYDKMRRSDGQIAAIYQAVTLPIRSAKWYLEPEEDAENKDQAQDIADFVDDMLMSGMKFPLEDHVREALLMLIYGFAIFEKVYKVDQWNGKPVVVLDKYAPRVASSIWRFPQDEQTFDVVGVEQLNKVTGQMATIPLDRLRIYTYQREGSDPTGISMFRPAYKHWYIKDSLYKIVAIGIEKSLLGTPIGKLPKSYSEDEKDKILAILSNVRTAENGAATIPNDIELDDLNLAGSAGVQNLAMQMIEHHDTEIARSVLAQFIQLGTMSTASGGSYALGNTMVDMFTMGLESIATYIENEIQKDIEEIVSWNFGPDAPIPQLKHKAIAFHNPIEVATAFGQLGSGHLINPDLDMENHFRTMFGIPNLTQEALDNMLLLPQNRYVPDIASDTPYSPNEQKLIQQRINQPGAGVQPGMGGQQMKEPVRFAEGGKWHRDLTKYEQTVKFAEMDQQWTTMEQQFVNRLQGVLGKASTQYIAQIANILNSDQTTAQKLAAVQALKFPLSPTYAATIQSEIKQAYHFGQQSVAQELSVSASASTTQANSAAMAAQAEALASLQVAKLSSALQLNAISMISRDMHTKSMLYQLKQTADNYIQGPDLKTSAMVTIADSINVGRGAEAKQHGVQGAQWSAVLDAKTCPLCSSLDGKVISVDNPDFDIFRPPLHYNCRCILVYILSEEQGVEFNWTTPDHSLVKHYGNLVNA